MTNLELFDPKPNDGPRVFGVRELNELVGRLLERSYGTVRVRGELSGVSRAASGHVYFGLQEAGAQIRCAFFRASAKACAVRLQDGIEVVATGRLGVYPVRGDYQLIVERIELSGEGARLQALERLKVKLRDEGLLDAARKRPLPPYPATIGVVTSAHGAALRDIVRVLDARWPGIEILVTPVPVQGEGAASAIADAIVRHGRARRAEVLIVGRGGGSVDDLWTFNEEVVARAIAGSPIPVVSAVGHELDVLLSDLVADLRAATPSQAAELVVRERREVQAGLVEWGERLRQGIRSGLGQRRDGLARYVHSHGLFRPRTALANAAQRVDDLSGRLDDAAASIVSERARGVEQLGRRLAVSTGSETRNASARLARAAERLSAAELLARDRRARRMSTLAASLRALDPSRVLSRGYAICTDAGGRAVTEGGELASGDFIGLLFHRGGAEGTISKSWSGASPAGEIEETSAS